MPAADFRTLLAAFNDQWVEAARFLSSALLTEMLRLSGEWSVQYCCDVDPSSPGEPVPMFGPPPGQSSPFWQAIAREFLERWAHHSQIRRALGYPSLATAPILDVGVQIMLDEVSGVLGDAHIDLGCELLSHAAVARRGSGTTIRGVALDEEDAATESRRSRQVSGDRRPGGGPSDDDDVVRRLSRTRWDTLEGHGFTVSWRCRVGQVSKSARW